MLREKFDSYASPEVQNKNLIDLIIGKLNNMKSNKNFLYKSKLNEKNSVIDLNNF